MTDFGLTPFTLIVRTYVWRAHRPCFSAPHHPATLFRSLLEILPPVISRSSTWAIPATSDNLLPYRLHILACKSTTNGIGKIADLHPLIGELGRPGANHIPGWPFSLDVHMNVATQKTPASSSYDVIDGS